MSMRSSRMDKVFLDGNDYQSIGVPVRSREASTVECTGALFESGERDQAFAFRVAAAWLERHQGEYWLLDVRFETSGSIGGLILTVARRDG